MLIEVPGININKQNKKEGNTPLHLAVLYEEDFEVALSMVNLLLDSGADPRYIVQWIMKSAISTHIFLCRIQNKAGSTVGDFVVGRSDDMRDIIDQALAGYEVVRYVMFLFLCLFVLIRACICIGGF